MGKLRFGLVVSLGLLGFAACQPLYGAPPEKVRDPSVVRHDPAKDAALEKITYIEDCELHTRVLHAPAVRDAVRSNALVEKAETTEAAAAKEAEPKKKGELVIDSVREFGQALEKDPYSAEATLKLALAYDRVRRKGCALALLGRLAQLANHKSFEREATVQIDDVEANRTWFSGYRKDAMKAVGRN